MKIPASNSIRTPTNSTEGVLKYELLHIGRKTIYLIPDGASYGDEGIGRCLARGTKLSVLLEALASGVPVAAFSVTGPRDVLGAAPVGGLNDGLRRGRLAALAISPQACLEFAAEHSWEASAGLRR